MRTSPGSVPTLTHNRKPYHPQESSSYTKDKHDFSGPQKDDEGHVQSCYSYKVDRICKIDKEDGHSEEESDP